MTRRSRQSKSKRDRRDGAPRGKVLRIGIIRGPRIVEERLIRGGESVSVGESTRNTFVLPGSEMPAQHRLFALRGGRYHLVVRDPMHGKLFVDDAVQSLEQVSGSLGKRRGADTWIPLSPGVRGKVQINGTTILFQFVQAPPEPKRIVADFGPFGLSQVDWVFTAFMVFSLVLNLVGYSYIQSQPPPRRATIADLENNYIVRDFIFPELPDPPDPLDPFEELDPDGTAEVDAPEDDPDTAETDPGSETDDGGETEDGEDGDASADTGEADEPTREQLYEDARDRMNTVGLPALIAGTGDTDSDLATRDLMANPDLLAKDVADAMDRARGFKVAGLGEPALRNLPDGGDDDGLEGPSTGPVTSGPVTLKPRDKVQDEVETTLKPEKPVTEPGADVTAITQLVGRKKGQIKACYDREVKTTPDLAGRVEVTIVVGPEGEVEEIWIEDNTTGSKDLADCMLMRIRRWTFPATGETYEVTYPFSMFVK